MSPRSGPSAVTFGMALCAALVAADRALADTIYFNDRGLRQRAQIEQGIAPARLFQDEHGLYLRGRILSATPGSLGGARPTLVVEAWSRSGDRFAWSSQPYTIGMDLVAFIDHEVDSHLDLQLIVSSRDEPDAPIGTAEWRARIRRVLDPGGEVGMSEDRSTVRPRERPEERARVTHPGWLLFDLVEEPPLLPPPEAGPDAARLGQEFERIMADRQRRFEEDLQRSGVNVLHPRSIGRPAGQAVWSLLQGIARAKRYPALAQRIDRSDEAPPAPRGPAARGMGKDFVQRATIVLGLMCMLADVPTRGAEEAGRAVVEPPGLRYARFGREARDALLAALETANPDHAGTGGQALEMPMRMSPAAALPVDPSDLGLAAMRIVQEFETFWSRARREGRSWVADDDLSRDEETRRLVRALLALARDDGSVPPVLAHEARRTLVRLLRPDVAIPPSLMWGDQRLTPEMVAKMHASAVHFREAMEASFSDADPAVRAAARSVVEHAAFVSSPRVIDELFGMATGDSVPDDAPRDARRASRRYALTVLTILGTLDDPEVPSSSDEEQAARDRETARDVFERLQRVRDRVEDGHGSRGERELVELLPDLPGRIDEARLSERVSRFLRHERRHVERAEREARRRLRDAADGRAVLDDEERTRVFEEANRLGRRLRSMPPPN
ncbi:MAG: hypothetical protein M9894_06255 [Planctomycetes bacterium]|nr:hypothetical protein [Planctomycetota bacterium]